MCILTPYAYLEVLSTAVAFCLLNWSLCVGEKSSLRFRYEVEPLLVFVLDENNPDCWPIIHCLAKACCKTHQFSAVIRR